jgi:hypothetical protein
MVQGKALQLICREKAQKAQSKRMKSIPILRFVRFLAAKVRCHLNSEPTIICHAGIKNIFFYFDSL